MSNPKHLTVLNLDKLIEDVVGVGGSIFKEISPEELKEFLMSELKIVYPSHDHYFALFKLIHEQPKKAIDLLEEVAKQRYSSSEKKYSYTNDGIISLLNEFPLFRKAKDPSFMFIREAGCELLESFENKYSRSPPPINSHASYYLCGLVKYNPEKALKFFQDCYEKLAKKGKKATGWDEDLVKILTIAECLKTRDFSRAEIPEHLELKVVPKKETIPFPENSNLDNSAKLSRYFMKYENASLENLGLIEGRAFLIPLRGEADWSKGLYIVTYKGKGETDVVYKTEKSYNDEELLSKINCNGKIIRELKKVATTIVDLA